MCDRGDGSRRIRTALAIGAGVVLCLPLAARAQPAPRETCRWSAQEPGPAQRQFREIDRAILARPSEEALPALIARLRHLLGPPCFRGIDDGWSLPSFKSMVSLVQWWQDGGDNWIKGALGGQSGRTVDLPPDSRKTLHLEANEKHPLASLLCRAADRSCGRETASWFRRGEEVLKHTQRFIPRASRTTEEHEKLCSSPAGKTPAERYRTWRACIEDYRALWNVLPPLGSFRAPTQGWLILRGRRGHYEYCDTLSAFDLQTGATFRSRLCGQLFPAVPAEVGGADARKPVFERGQVPVDQLREAALMIILWPERQEDVARSVDWFKMPDGLQRVALPGARPARAPSPIHMSSGDTGLSWEWLDGQRRLASGDLLFAPELKRQNGYPSWLLEIAEAGFYVRCPPAPLPAQGLAGSSSPLVSFLDAPPGEQAAADVELGLALKAGAAAPCSPAEKR